jgi:hypothetical protein
MNDWMDGVLEKMLLKDTDPVPFPCPNQRRGSGERLH